MPVAVLMYHGVGEPADPTGSRRYTVTEEEMRSHLAALERSRVLPARELVSGASCDGVVLSFDDGDASILAHAAPLLAARKTPAIVFMTSTFVGRRGYLDAAGLRELSSMGFEIGSHGATHRFLSTLGDRDLDEELVGSRQRLEDFVGQPVTNLSLPGGRGSMRVTLRSRALGYEAIWTSRPGWNERRPDPFAIRRTAIRRGTPAELVRSLAECDPVAHARDFAVMTARGIVRAAIGEERYHRLTDRILTMAGRR